jgi:phytoene dehydrogenase-like protein
MLLNKGARIAVIGAGISGITAANVLKKNGFEPVVFEKSDQLGGVSAVAYPNIHLQNTYPSYHLSDFPWPFKPDLHPSAAQILKYWNDAVKHLRLDVRLSHEVRAWKRANIQFEPSRSLATNTRFQQYIDILLKDLGVSPYRKLPNIFAEIFGRYGSADYKRVVEEYNMKSSRGSQPRLPLQVDT